MIVLAKVRPHNSQGSFRSRSMSVPEGLDTLEIILNIRAQGYEVNAIMENPTKDKLEASNWNKG